MTSMTTPAGKPKSAKKPEDQAEATDMQAMAEQTFGHLLRVLRMMQSHLQQLEDAHGLSGAQLLALWQLSVNPDQRVSELASALHLQRSSTSNLLDKLESRKLVTRSRNEQDQRIVIVSLTEEGRAVVRRVPGPMGGLMRQAIKALPLRTLHHLHDGVIALVDALDGTAAQDERKSSPD